MVTWLEADVSGSPRGSVARTLEGVDLRVGPSQLLMPALGQHLSVTNQNAPHHGVRMNPPPTIAADLDGPLEVLPVGGRKGVFHLVRLARSEGQAKRQGPEFGAGRRIESGIKGCWEVRSEALRPPDFR